MKSEKINCGVNFKSADKNKDNHTSVKSIDVCNVQASVKYEVQDA